MEVYISVEEKVMNISEAIQRFYSNIVDLEAWMTQSTPLEERQQREQIASMEKTNI